MTQTATETTRRGRGRPSTDPAAARRAKERWRAAQALSGLTAQGIADMLGCSKSLVWSYASVSGTVPSDAALQRLEDWCRERIETERLRLRLDEGRTG